MWHLYCIHCNRLIGSSDKVYACITGKNTIFTLFFSPSLFQFTRSLVSFFQMPTRFTSSTKNIASYNNIFLFTIQPIRIKSKSSSLYVYYLCYWLRWWHYRSRISQQLRTTTSHVSPKTQQQHSAEGDNYYYTILVPIRTILYSGRVRNSTVLVWVLIACGVKPSGAVARLPLCSPCLESMTIHVTLQGMHTPVFGDSFLQCLLLELYNWLPVYCHLWDASYTPICVSASEFV